MHLKFGLRVLLDNPVTSTLIIKPWTVGKINAIHYEYPKEGYKEPRTEQKYHFVCFVLIGIIINPEKLLTASHSSNLNNW